MISSQVKATPHLDRVPLVCPDEEPVPPVPLEGEPLLVVEADHLLNLALAVTLQAGKGQHLEMNKFSIFSRKIR